MPWQRLMQTRDRLPVAVSLDEWYAMLLERLGNPPPFELALLGGRLAATPGLAFLAGYQGALRVLWPSAPWSLGALCVTENKSVRPADMGTRLSGLTLSGRKDYVTAAEAADWLLVAAREEAAEQAPRLALGVVRAGAPGVRIETLPALPLMPDIGRARLHLADAHCQRLAGDGWDDYVKPFRSIEDLHVLTALSAWLSALGQELAWPQPLQLRLLGLLAGCAEVSRLSANSPATHVLLAGLFAQFAALSSELDAALDSGPEAWAALWRRDKGLLSIGGVARNKRLAKAEATLGLMS